MLVVSYWSDSHGRVHRQAVTVRRGGSVPLPGGDEFEFVAEDDGDLIAGGFVSVVGWVDAADPGALPGTVLTGALPEGTARSTRAAWEQQEADQAALAEASVSEYLNGVREAEAKRRAAMTKLAEAVGLSPDEVSAIVGGGV